MNKQIRTIAFILLIPVLWCEYLYLANKDFGFNAEFVVFLCFIVFVTVAYRTIQNLVIDSTSSSSNDIKKLYKNTMEEIDLAYKGIIGTYSKYDILSSLRDTIFLFALENSKNSYNLGTIEHIKSYYVFLKNELELVVALNALYYQTIRYNFLQSFSKRLSGDYSNNLLEFTRVCSSLSNSRLSLSRSTSHYFNV